MENSWLVRVHIVLDHLLKHELLLGANFLKSSETILAGDEVMVKPLKQECTSEEPNVCSIDSDDFKCDVVNLEHIQNEEIKTQVLKIIVEYKPCKVDNGECTNENLVKG